MKNILALIFFSLTLPLLNASGQSVVSTLPSILRLPVLGSPARFKTTVSVPELRKAYVISPTQNLDKASIGNSFINATDTN